MASSRTVQQILDTLGAMRTLLVVALVVVVVGLALHYFGGEVTGWMASLHGRPSAH